MESGNPGSGGCRFDPLLYDSEVRDLALAKTRGHMVLAELCASAADNRTHNKLMFRSLGDYALEKLGMRAGFFFHLIAAGRRLRNLPEISKALYAGELNWSQAVELCRVATPETEGAYLGVAKGRTVRWLRRAVRQLQMSAQEAEPSARPLSLTPAPLPGGEGIGGEGIENEVDLSVDPSPDGLVPLPEPRGTLRLKVPLRLVLKWEVFQDFCRKIEGQPLPQGECLFMLAGEAQAIGLPDHVTEQARYDMPEITVSQTGTAARSHSEVGPPENPATLWRWLDWDQVSGERSHEFDLTWALEGIDREDPLALDKRIVATQAYLQQVDRHLGRLLRRALNIQLYKTLGFSNFESYAQERLGISKSRAFELIRTADLLSNNLKIEEAYASGKLSVSQASAVALIAKDETAEAWIRYAQEHPVAHLLRTVRYCRVACFSHPELMDGNACFPPSREVELRLQMSVLDRPEDTDPDRSSWVPQEELTETLVLSGQLWVIELVREAMLRVISQAPRRLRPYEAFEMLVDDFVATHGQLEHREPVVLVRDDYRCQVPCCTRSVVEVHHIRFRSAGGTNDHSNVTAICPHHHRHGIHTGRIRLSGTAPLELSWLFRLEPNARPFAYYRHQRRVWPQTQRPATTDQQIPDTV